ncbi:uncharacterized protein isoform X3 [Choristoneura fumiferana]|uniref:uncharacterized protein isoform X3 n=1 Tax=Choristoneura fumiferana TaxID=7141 RepID=UPI003D15B086
MFKPDFKMAQHGPDTTRKPFTRPQPLQRRSQSFSPTPRNRVQNPSQMKKFTGERRCASLSPSANNSKKCIPQESASSPATLKVQPSVQSQDPNGEKDVVLPQFVITKILRSIATKRREFLKMRKQLIAQQNAYLEMYAHLRELEGRAGTTTGDSIGDVRVLSVTGWAAHDLLLLVRENEKPPPQSEVTGVFGPQILQQLSAQLLAIPEEVLSMGAEIMARRLELLNLVRGKHRTDRSTYLTNLEWKSKNTEFDVETEKLHRLVAGTAKNLEAKVTYCLEVAKIPWIDRETLIKKIERLQRENAVAQSKLEDILTKRESEEIKEGESEDNNSVKLTELLDELQKERAAREALKEVVSAAESMLRVARARIATLERQLKESRGDLENMRRKHKDLEQLYRHRETSFDARSKKLLEVSKTGEVTIEALARQRDALELRVKELRDQAEAAQREAEAREAEQKSRFESLQAKEKHKKAATVRVHELEARVKELEEQLHALRERSSKLVDLERQRCAEYLPSKETEPTERETEIFKELQATRMALARAEEEMRQSRADKDSLLNSLARIAQEGPANKMAEELLEREQKITKLQQIIEEQKENEKIMEQSMTQYENQLASLRLETKRLRNYDCYVKDMPSQELHTELIDLSMQLESLNRERSALMSAAASRALMLERNERSADLFGRVLRARHDLAAALDGRSDAPSVDQSTIIETTRSLSSLCATAAETWTALRSERQRVLRLESAVLAQGLQLEREGRVRTQLERRRAVLEREIIRTHNVITASEPNVLFSNANVVHKMRDFLWFRK